MSYPTMYMSDEPPDHLCQGDIFQRFSDTVLPKSELEDSGFMVLTYTCDLKNPEDLSHISVCPIFEFEHMAHRLAQKLKDKTKKKLETIITNQLHRIAQNRRKFYFFLAPTLNLIEKPTYANLSQINSVRKEYIPDLLDNRICCLTSPWREKLGFMLGYIYNRVATANIDKDPIEKYVSDTKDEIHLFLKDF